jgi:hypothetical protein
LTAHAAIAKRMNAKDRPNLTSDPWTTDNLRKFMTKMKKRMSRGMAPPTSSDKKQHQKNGQVVRQSVV